MDAARDEHREYTVTLRDRTLDDVTVVRRSWNDRDASLEPLEFLDALVAAHADHLVASIERVLHHVLPELPRGADDANLQRASFVGLIRSWFPRIRCHVVLPFLRKAGPVRSGVGARYRLLAEMGRAPYSQVSVAEPRSRSGHRGTTISGSLARDCGA